MTYISIGLSNRSHIDIRACKNNTLMFDVGDESVTICSNLTPQQAARIKEELDKFLDNQPVTKYLAVTGTESQIQALKDSSNLDIMDYEPF